MLLGCCVGPDRLPKVLEAGFDYAELPCRVTMPNEDEAVWSQERKKLADHAVPILSFNILIATDLRVVGKDIRKDALKAYLDVVFHRMSELGGKYVSFGSGGARRVPDGFDRQQAKEQLIAFMDLLADAAEKYHIQVNIEPLNRKETNIILNLKEAHSYALQLNHPRIRILADIYHMMEESEPMAHVADVASTLGYVHLADSGRRWPGSGSYPYDEFFSNLRNVGYVGPMSVECNWGDMDAEMPKAAEFIRSKLT